MTVHLMSLEEQRSVHSHCKKNKSEIVQSTLCGCFYCIATFLPSAIEEWVDAEGFTAVCPRCGIDSVLGNAQLSVATDKTILRQMHRFWFDNDKTGLRSENA